MGLGAIGLIAEADGVGEVEELVLGTTVLQAKLEELVQLGLRVGSEGLFHRKTRY